MFSLVQILFWYYLDLWSRIYECTFRGRKWIVNFFWNFWYQNLCIKTTYSGFIISLHFLLSVRMSYFSVSLQLQMHPQYAATARSYLRSRFFLIFTKVLVSEDVETFQKGHLLLYSTMDLKKTELLCGFKSLLRVLYYRAINNLQMINFANNGAIRGKK